MLCRLIFSFSIVLSSGLLWGKEFFVAPHGNNQNKGSVGAPFKTIQHGVNALSPGDTLTILPGRYHEAVLWRFNGSPRKITTVRAQIPGTVLLHGDVPVSGFKAVPGKNNCFVLPYPQMPEGVNESDTYNVYKKDDSFVVSPHASYNAYSYDAAKKLLYIATSDGKAPEFHAITVSRIPRYGFNVLPVKGKVRNVVIEGLSARGFSRIGLTAHSSLWGFSISSGENCIIRNCNSYLNEGGISFYASDKCRIENCRGYANGTSKFVVGGNFGGYSCKNSTIDNCFSFKSRTGGAKFYGTNFCNTISNTISIEDYRGHLRIKPNDKGSKFINNYAPGLVGCYRNYNCVFVRNDYDPEGKGGPTSLILKKRHVTSFPNDFADPWNFDLRLQKNSQLKQGFAGTDFYFVSPSGNDKNDGRSVKSPWKSLKNVPDGATVYLLPGTYAGGLELTASNVTVAGRGQHAPILIKGGKNGLLVKGNNTTLKLLEFSGQSGSAVVLSKGKLTVERCHFTKLGNCVSVLDSGSVHIAHSNVAADVKNILSGEKITGSFLHNISKHSPKKLFSCSNAPAPQKELSFDGLPLGTYFFLCVPQELKANNITANATSSTTAEVYWTMNCTPGSRLYYKESTAKAYKMLSGIAKDSFFHSISLRELKPDTQYDFYLSFQPKINYTVGSSCLPRDLDLRKLKSASTKSFSFRTPAKDRAPRTWYVAVNGNDKNSGDKTAPFRTVSRAALATAPGDTVIIGEGTYTEIVYITASGKKGKPITFKAAPRAEVWFEGAHRRFCRAFVLWGKEYLNFDGLRFKEFGTEFPNGSGSFVVFGGGNITISRCMHDGRGQGYSCPFFNARYTKNFTLTQSVCIDGMTAMTMVEADNVKITNNIFKKPSIWVAAFLLSDKGKFLFANNIVTDNIRAKISQSPLHFSHWENIIEKNNIYFMRYPRELRKITGCWINGKYVQMTLDEFYKKKGEDGKSFFIDPGIKVLSTQLCWKNNAERERDMKKGMLFFKKNNIEEDGKNPQKTTQYRHWNFEDFFAPEIYKKYKIGLNDALFKDVSVKPQKGYDQR